MGLRPTHRDESALLFKVYWFQKGLPATIDGVRSVPGKTSSSKIRALRQQLFGCARQTTSTVGRAQAVLDCFAQVVGWMEEASHRG